MKINHLSSSRYQVFEECVAKYKYRYHLDIITPEKFHFTYGKIVHKIIEEFTKNRGKMQPQEAMERILSGEVPIEGERKAPALDVDNRKRLSTNFNHFLRLSEKTGLDGDVEWAFKYDLEPPNEKNLIGFIDRVIRKQDEFFLIDYKTTKQGIFRKTPKTIKKDIQLRTYCMIIRHVYKVPAANIRAALYYLEDGVLVPATFTEAELDETEIVLKKAYNEIIAADPETVRGNVGKHCYNCDYKQRCSFFNAV